MKNSQDEQPFEDPALNALLNAAKNHDRHHAETLVRNSVPVKYQLAVLEHLLRGQNLAAAKVLIEAGVNPNELFGDCSLLFMASARGNVQAVTFLLENGADPRLRNRTSGWTAVEIALSEGHMEIAAILTRLS